MSISRPAPTSGSKSEASPAATMPQTIALPINRATGTLAICAVVTLWLAPYGHLSHRMESMEARLLQGQSDTNRKLDARMESIEARLLQGQSETNRKLDARMESMEARLLQGESDTNRKLDALLLHLIPDAAAP